jgi:hypothetical protein
VRFPLRLPVTVSFEGKKMPAESQNISSSGAVFQLDEAIPVGAAIQFTIAMPGSRLCLPKDMLVDCTGRVVRCSPMGSRHELAAMIDEYRFQRQ